MKGEFTKGRIKNRGIIKYECYLSPETSLETALKTICRYEFKVKITTPKLKNILNYTFSMEEIAFPLF